MVCTKEKRPTLARLELVTGACFFALCGVAPCQSVSGVVRDAKGTPVRNAEIVVERGTSSARLVTDRAGNYSQQTNAGGGRLRITVTGKGFVPATVEALIPDATPACRADVILKKGKQQPQSDTGSLTCEEPAPYASMLTFEAAIACGGGQNPPGRSGGEYFQTGTVFIGGGNECTSMFVVGNYILQRKPASRQPVMIRVAKASETASWTLSRPGLAALTKIEPRMARLEFAEDGDADLLLEEAGQVLLRVRLNARTFSDGWQLTATRVTEKGEIIDMDGHVFKQK